MIKPNLLRKTLENSNAFIKENPDKLHVFVDDGDIDVTAASSLSFEYHYTLNLVITDYGESVDLLMVPLIGWMYLHQQEMMGNPDLRKDAISYEVDHLNNQSCDISITLKLSERVIVKMGEKGLEYKHCNDEPPLDMRPEWVNKIWPTT